MSRLIQIFVSQAQGLAVPEQQAELEAQRLELELDQLEDRVRRLLDPGHAEFDCDLPMAQLIYGKQRLAQQLAAVGERLQQLPVTNDHLLALGWLLEDLQQKYDLVSLEAQSSIEDLPRRTKLRLGLPCEEE